MLTCLLHGSSRILAEWSIGEPDVVVTWEYNVPAVGADLFGDIYSTDLIGKFSEGRYIKAIQTRAADDASRRVVHHALVLCLQVITTELTLKKISF